MRANYIFQMGQVLFGVDTHIITQENAISIYDDQIFNPILTRVGFSKPLVKNKHQIKWTSSDIKKERLAAAFFLIWGTYIKEDALWTTL